MRAHPVRLHRAISIHIPRVGDDRELDEFTDKGELFQSTSPVWGMTINSETRTDREDDFNPHPPCGG